ncbi:DUF2267 domain-containing protein [Chelatococcus asaccharovorans]|uniref:DUF2267 domain-containing protein n=1 Tax=Chelatococcus asaccharovorans TaxID=28210 RepID=A0A2V3U1E0_9HYPH|nr:DUF2267 domain-containing protein [Chelatococcus asaccharovorans]MBS7702485.1 DUF2267 domain-containing protein [Chelatococcus asaccharovorans]PXW56306.1 hypothetical protein C7450_10855 [Chelatococcus asaccharovorans]CAH1670885.1 conserved hypothetical protein [Chelatococcus asaccharovorans]CAH1677665.1 conserved hypothetical protein [Chelatococcus asaccharovorans]
MDELVTLIGEKVGIDTALARRAVGIVLAFLQREGPETEVNALVAALPGADQAIAEAGTPSQGGGLMGALGSLMGGSGGIMALGSELTAAGLSMGQMQTLGQELFAYGREKAGEDVMGAIIGEIPGLSQFV